MRKKIGIISKKQKIAEFHKRTLEGLFGDGVDIYPYSFERRNITHAVRCDVYLVTATSYDIMQEQWVEPYMPPEEMQVQAVLTFTRNAIELLKSYPVGTRALMANQTRHMAVETLSQLYHLGVSNIEFSIYYPEMEEVPDADLVFEPGDPEDALTDRPVIDLGNRCLNINTISEIALRIGCSSVLESEAFERYTATLADADYSLQELAYQNLTADNKLEVILNSLDAGIICVDEEDRITLVNKPARLAWRLNGDDLTGQSVQKRFPELHFQKETMAAPHLCTIGGIEYQVSYAPIRLHDKYLGAYATLQRFEETENAQIAMRRQKAQRSNTARYTFNDIIGDSEAMRKAKDLGLRLARKNASVLIEGESGTGKELFAQAIHNASDRAHMPFIAVNCAALTETLLESELFGYVDGAFTGAKKGGKEGLFEYAHRGTLFLDEIETMSPGLQAKLLRVLQEREVTRIGSVQQIPIDVRVISASNEDILQRVEDGSFRRDLYYRLNVIPLHTPALRERREDILPLLMYYARKSGQRLTFTERARVALIQHNWPGNVRELRNLVEYFALMELSEIDAADLPEQFQARQRKAALQASQIAAKTAARPHTAGFSGSADGVRSAGLSGSTGGSRSSIYSHAVGGAPSIPVRVYSSSAGAGTGALSDPTGLTVHDPAFPLEQAVFGILADLYQKHRGIGRQGMVYALAEQGEIASEYEVRMVFDRLQQQGWLTTARGRGGTMLTPAGYQQYLQQTSEETLG